LARFRVLKRELPQPMYPRIGLAVALCVVIAVFFGGLFALLATVAPDPLYPAVFSVVIVLGAAAAVALLVRYRRTSCLFCSAEGIYRINASGQIDARWRRHDVMRVRLYVGGMKWTSKGGSSRIGQVLVIETKHPDNELRLTSWFWTRSDMEQLAALLGKPIEVRDELAPAPVEAFDIVAPEFGAPSAQDPVSGETVIELPADDSDRPTGASQLN
jgi:hypothetical protein